MPFFISCFFISWCLWFGFANKQRFREIIPFSFFAAALAVCVDYLAIPHYWEYPCIISWFPTVSSAWGTFFVSAYFFIQWLPKKRSLFFMFIYIFCFSLVSLGIEWIYQVTGHMKYHHGWGYSWSFVCDVVILLVMTILRQLISPSSSQKILLDASKLDLEDKVIIIDRDKRIILKHGAWFVKNGINPVHFLGKKINEVMNEDAVKIHEEAMQKAFSGEYVVYQWRWNLIPHEPSYCFQTCLSPLRNPDGEIVGLLAIDREVHQVEPLAGIFLPNSLSSPHLKIKGTT